jgi:predicted AlkP superfamily phosphohydrolase/phosphomutase
MSRTLLLGLDGATRTCLDPLFEQGVMPFLKGFIERGASGTLMSTVCPVTPPAWTSILTGRTPGYHGIYDFIRVENQTLDHIPFRLANARDIRSEPVWSITGRMGKPSAILNFPNTFLAPPFDGVMIPGFVTSRVLRTSVHPRSYWNRIKELPGFQLEAAAWDLDENRKTLLTHRLDLPALRDWIDYMIAKERSWHAIARDLIDEGRCELVAVVFEGVDRLQHMLWDVLDPAWFPADPSDEDLAARDAIHQYFRVLDELLADLVEAAGPEARVFIVSDHGFGSTTEIFFANRWLEQAGYLAWKPDAEYGSDEQMSARNMRDQFDAIDWDATVAYARTASANGIYLVSGLSRSRPALSPEARRALADEIAAKLLAFRDPADGAPVVTQVVHRDDAYPGPAKDEAPDLVLTLRDGGFVSITRSDEILKPRPQVKGTHRPEGVWFAGGAGIRQGVEVGELSVIDVAPTLLYSLELPVPDDMEGRVVTDVFAPADVEARPVRLCPASGEAYPDQPAGDEPEVASESMRPGEQNAVLERLKALGYME